MIKKLRNKFLGAKLNVKITILIAVAILFPISIFSFYIFHSMEMNSVNEKKQSLEYSMNHSYEQILKNVESINMSTQFFLSDNKFNDFLVAQKRGYLYSAEELIEFTNSDIVSLERMVNNNPYLYQIRVYVNNSQMQEIMPILYRKDRMLRLDWADDNDISGWKYDYTDQIFDSFKLNQNEKIMSLVTPIDNYLYGNVGILEVAMEMKTMFPMLYEDADGEWNYFIDSNGNIYCKDGIDEKISDYLPQICNNVRKENGEACIETMDIDGKLAVVGGIYIKELNGHLICIRSMAGEIKDISDLRLVFLLLMALFVLIMIVLCNYIVNRLLKQFYNILHAIREVQKGDMDVVIDNCGNDEMGELSIQINTMLKRLKLLMEDNINRQLLVKNSEIRALQNQINAHFIYNVLESVKMMAEIDEEYEISDAITKLGRLLRYSMKWTSGNVTVQQELEYITDYLLLINLRFDYEIRLSLNIPEAIMIQEIPKMSLQPIVENSIYHGIEQMAEDTTIYVKGFMEDSDCIIEITDAGRGMSKEEVREVYKKISGEIDSDGGANGNGIGLKNVQDRIRMSFGEQYGLEISSELGCYTKVRVRVPMSKLYVGSHAEKSNAPVLNG